jgi:ubiquinol-cytochrome c reductase cytochrome c1 subunit
MKKTLLLTLSATALMMAVPAFATSDAKPASTVDEPAASATQTPETGKPEAAAAKAEGAASSAPATATAPTTQAEPQKEEPGTNDASSGAMPTNEEIELPEIDWSFDGPFGTFDRHALQRGFQVYKQVCSACHSLDRVAYRNLAALGYNEGEIKAFAHEATIQDGPNDQGEMFTRPGVPADHFPAPFANEQAARYANGGALPPDLSLIVRARHGGANYVHAILTGFSEPPAGFALNEGKHYNKYFTGHQISMPQPLQDDSVTFDDGTPATIDQEARDVATFLAWASDPTMELRKQTGLKVLIFLSVFSVLMYLTKRKIWKDMH